MLDELRRRGPLHRVQEGAGFFLVTRHEDALRVAQDPKVFPQTLKVLATGEESPFELVPETLNGPLHAKWRRLLGAPFSMTIAQEEIFGPVLAVIGYDGDEDAVRIANDSSYGLSGGVFSASGERAMSIARRIRTGSISVNGGVWYGADGPYGGYKTSGIGRQNGIEGFETYLETKLIGVAG